MRAEREKRAVILTSEGQRDAAINTAEGEKQQVIKASEARRQQQINEAEGQASAIIGRRPRHGRRHPRRGRGDQMPGGFEAVQLRVAEQYITQFGHLAKTNNTMIMPATTSDIGGMIATAMQVVERRRRTTNAECVER